MDERAQRIYALFPSDVFSSFGKGLVLGILTKELKAAEKEGREKGLRGAWEKILTIVTKYDDVSEMISELETIEGLIEE